MREGDIEILRLLAEYEEALDFNKPENALGWCWRDVRIQPAVLNRLFIEGYLDNPFKSNSYTGYRLSSKGNNAVRNEPIEEEITPEDLTIPDDLFDVIEGYE